MPLAGDLEAALAQLPSTAGVGQILAADGKSLVVSTASNLRRWASEKLGLGKKPAAGRRPRLDLSPIAAEVAFAEIEGAFRQRLCYERLMAPLVPLASRRDLKPPVYLHLDPEQRFPRVSVRDAEADPKNLYGPFRDRRGAEKARDALHRLFPLRPCDLAFEPDPTLPLGVGCLYAQVRSCAAPCLARVSEGEYRALAARAASWLADPRARGDAEASVPATIAAAAAAQGLVLDVGRKGAGLCPVRAGRVLDEAALFAEPKELEDAVARLAWPPSDGPDDWPWLLAWLRGPRRRAAYLLTFADDETPGLLARVRAALPERFGDTVGATRGGA